MKGGEGSEGRPWPSQGPHGQGQGPLVTEMRSQSWRLLSGRSRESLERGHVAGHSGCTPASRLSPHGSHVRDLGSAGAPTFKPQRLSSFASPRTDPSHQSGQSPVGVEVGSRGDPITYGNPSQRPVAASPGDGQGSGRLGLPWSGLPCLEQRPPGQSVLCCGGCPVHPRPCSLEAKHTHPTWNDQRCL